MRSRILLLAGSVTALLAGMTLITSSLFTIHAESASMTGSGLLPALVSFDHATSTQAAQSKLKAGDFIGTLVIARLNRSIPIYEGTSSSELKKGAGHYIKSVLPGSQDNTVIAGHRDSVFTQFGLLKHGDLLVINTSYGKFTYAIQSFRVVDANDRTVIVPTKVATLTLSTCFPFHFVGSAPQRFIATAELIK